MVKICQHCKEEYEGKFNDWGLCLSCEFKDIEKLIKGAY